MMHDIKEMIEQCDSAVIAARENPQLTGDAIRNCNANIRKLTRVLSSPTTTTSRKSQLIAAIGQLRGIRLKLKALQVSGGSLRPAHPNRGNYASSRVKWEDLKSVFNGRIRTGCIINLTHKDPIEFFEDCGPLFVRRITNALKKDAFLKINAVFCGRFIKATTTTHEQIEDLKYMNTKNEVISRDSNLSEWFASKIMNKILAELGDFQEKDSGWALSEIVNLTININKYTPQLGSSYIELPPQIAEKKACINVRNNDDACFAWAVLAALHPAQKDPQRVNKYRPYMHELNLSGVQFPITRPDIEKFEENNNISVNVYVLEKTKQKYTVAPTRLTGNKREKHVNLLLIQNHYDENSAEPIRYHYVWIKDLSRLVSTQLSHHKGRNYFCDRCLHYFYTEERLQQHVIDCERLNEYRVIFPKENGVKFGNHKYKERVPFIVYADFECLLRPVSERSNNTERYQRHEPHSVGYYVKCSYDESLSGYNNYRGPACAEWFAKELRTIAEKVEQVHQNALPMNSLTPQQAANFSHSTTCHICCQSFKPGDIKVQDHCHLSGKYRGAAHQGCNINYQDSKIIPVVFHNLSNYDAHLLIRDVANTIPGHLKIIPNNTEKYISIVKYVEGSDVRFKFIDSFRFMPSSLDKLASYLDIKRIVQSQFPDLDEDKLRLLTRKGIFPYEHVKDWSNLDETQLPDYKNFYSSLNESYISHKDYQNAQKVWSEFGIKSLGEYSDLYLKTNVLLLADVFENFRDGCLAHYGLDPAHYYTVPDLAWDVMLKITGVELDYIQDVDILTLWRKEYAAA